MEGTQIVYTKDNKIQFIGNYKRGRLNGKFIIFKNKRKSEEGIVNQYGLIDKYINYDNNELSYINYPLKNSILNGNYIEKFNFFEIKIKYKDGFFDGYYSINDLSSHEYCELRYYNSNNYTITKYKFKTKVVIFKKVLEKYTIELYNPISNNFNVFYLSSLE